MACEARYTLEQTMLDIVRTHDEAEDLNVMIMLMRTGLFDF